MATLTTNEVIAKLLKEIRSYVQPVATGEGTEISQIIIGGKTYSFVEGGASAIHGVSFLSGDFKTLDDLDYRLYDEPLGLYSCKIDKDYYLIFSNPSSTIAITTDTETNGLCYYSQDSSTHKWGTKKILISNQQDDLIYVGSDEPAQTNFLWFQITEKD